MGPGGGENSSLVILKDKVDMSKMLKTASKDIFLARLMIFLKNSSLPVITTHAKAQYPKTASIYLLKNFV